MIFPPISKGHSEKESHYLPFLHTVEVSKPLLHRVAGSTNKTNWERGRIIDFAIISLIVMELSGSSNAANRLQLKAVAVPTPPLQTGVIKPEAGQVVQGRQVTKEKRVEKKPQCCLTGSQHFKLTHRNP